MVKETKYCDRCRAEIPFGHYPRAAVTLRGSIRFGHGEFEYLDEHYDLCKKCSKAFTSFMKGGERLVANVDG